MLRFASIFVVLFFPIKSIIHASNQKIPSLKELCTGYLSDNYSKHTPKLIRQEEYLYLTPTQVLKDIFIKATDPGKLRMLDTSIQKNNKLEKKEFEKIKRKFRNLLEKHTFCLENPISLTNLNSELVTNLHFKSTDVFQLSSIFENLKHPLKNLMYLKINYEHTETSHHPYKTQSITISSEIFPDLFTLELISSEEKNTLQPFLKFEFTYLKGLSSLTLENVIVGESYNELPKLSPKLSYLKLKSTRYIKNLSRIEKNFRCALEGDIYQNAPIAVIQLIPEMPEKMTVFLDGYFFYPFFLDHLKNLNIQNLRLKGHTYSNLDYRTITSMKSLNTLKLLISDAILENYPFPNINELNIAKQSLPLKDIGQHLENLHIEKPIKFVDDFSLLKNIVTLDLYNQILSQSQIIQLFSLPHLKKLSLENINLEKDTEETFKLEQYSLIEDFSLSSNNHKEILPFVTKTFTLPFLKKINLSYPNTTCTPEDFSNHLTILLKNTTELESLNLVDIQLTQKDIDLISTQKTLKELKIKETGKSVSYTAKELEPLEKLELLENLWVTFKSSSSPEAKITSKIDLNEFLFLLQLKNIKNIFISNPKENIQKNEALKIFKETVFKKIRGL